MNDRKPQIYLKRKFDDTLIRWKENQRRLPLIIKGARQVGKTFIVREFARTHYKSFIEFNFIKNPAAREIFEKAADEKDVLLRLSAMADGKLIPGRTLIFFDEVQVCPEAVTFVKFLVEEGSYRYVFSGSLLGVELRNVRSVPVGYMDEVMMYPLDFEEFLIANGVRPDVMAHLRECYEKRRSPDPVVHERMMRYFRLYLVVGGMPAAVQTYLDTNDLKRVMAEQKQIIVEYKRDVTQYDERLKMRLRRIYSLIPSELNKQNKRFYLKNVSARGRFDRVEDDFAWLKEAGVAIPAFNVDEPKVPLELATKANLFKLFLNDVGLLAAQYASGIQMKMLNDELNINFGSVYENAVAQELTAHGIEPRYYNSPKKGEIDFVIERDGEALPIEVKSGKHYQRHRALNFALEQSEYRIREALVFNDEVLKTEGRVRYVPIYMVMFLQKDVLPAQMIYEI